MTNRSVPSTDGYFLKIVLFALLGTIWMRINGQTLLPLGLLAGLVYARHEHFQIDRKIEYAVLICAALIGLGGAGLYVNIVA